MEFTLVPAVYDRGVRDGNGGFLGGVVGKEDALVICRERHVVHQRPRVEPTRENPYVPTVE